MIILPAIDIKDGCCVRLRKGDFSTAHKVAEDAGETAASFLAAGARWIHMVDLDGAKEGEVKNAPLFLEIARTSGLKVELGGGIRDRKTIEYYLENGISRVILGSIAVKNPALVREAAARLRRPDRRGHRREGGDGGTEGWSTRAASAISISPKRWSGRVSRRLSLQIFPGTGCSAGSIWSSLPRSKTPSPATSSRAAACGTCATSRRAHASASTGSSAARRSIREASPCGRQ